MLIPNYSNLIYFWSAFSILIIPFVSCCYKFVAKLEDPCKKLDCNFGAECIRSRDGRTAECTCPSKCYNYGDSVGSRPVCGSDGRNYPNECELQRQACNLTKNIVVKFQGKCDPCEEVQCPITQICQLDENRNPICRCNAICPYEFKPVCGSNGKTYINECFLRVEGCKAQKSLRIMYSGECGSGRGTNSCDSLKCGIHQECDIDRYGIATCICPLSCPLKLDSVCGSDGITYDSECVLRRETCLKQKNVTMIYKGQCGKDGVCDGFKCEFGAICTVNVTTLKPFCDCPSCEEEYNPVCGSDSVSYTNECKLRRSACEQQKNIHIIHYGFCYGCKDVKCEFYSTCKSDGNGNGQCICPQNCSFIQSPVCGSDGVTYSNECELRAVACSKKEYLTVASKAVCNICFNVHCKYGARCENGNCICPTDCPPNFDPVCSSDGVTYINECQLRVTACQKNSDITIAFYGDCREGKSSEIEIGTGYIKTCDHNTCRFGGICDYDAEGIPHCICSYQCPPKGAEESVCGSDGRLYENECKLQEEACRRQQDIEIEDSQLCEENKVIACDGDTPLIDPSTGKDYYCGEELGAKQCPPNSYCHESAKFSKCCLEIDATKRCSESPNGCCPDGITAVLGANNFSCPNLCKCNKLGSYSTACEPITKQCNCKPGVGGLQCDRCEPGYWGLHKISEGNSGCIPCSCNKHGSAREDCDQMTGRCICKQGLQGMKCNICPDDTILDSSGCIHVSLTKVFQTTCSNLKCKFGASCKQVSERGAQCHCNISCPLALIKENKSQTNSQVLCGTDGNTYLNECLLRLFACRMQKQIVIAHKRQCLNEESTRRLIESVTMEPVRRSTDFKATQQNKEKSLFDLSFSYSGPISLKSTSALPKLPKKSISIPSFWGHSYISLPRLQAYSRLSIELEFISYSEFGILLYNGQTMTGEGDFVSISINKGFVEFRYDLGSGKVIISSSQPIKLGEMVKLTAKRYLKDGILTIVGQEDTFGKSLGDLKSLDLAESLYIGNIAANVSEIIDNIGVGQGFVGCIKKLKFGRKNVDLSYLESQSYESQAKFFEVYDCKSITCYNRNPCLNLGVCMPILKNHNLYSKDSFECKCDTPFSGKYCETRLDICTSESPCIKGSTCINLPKGGFSCLCSKEKSHQLCSQSKRRVEDKFVADFWGTSFLVLPTLQNIAKSFVIEIWFLTRDLNGLLFYNGQESFNEKGDFISLNIINGFIEYKYNLGSRMPNKSGVVTLTTKEPISINEWHSLRITRNKTKGSLQLDDGFVEYGEAQGYLNELNLDQPLFIGAVDNISSIHKESGINRGLNGAIQRIVVNGEVWDDLVSQALKQHNVGQYIGPPCGYQNPCPSGALCIPHFQNFDCKCIKSKCPPFNSTKRYGSR